MLTNNTPAPALPNTDDSVSADEEQNPRIHECERCDGTGVIVVYSREHGPDGEPCPDCEPIMEDW